MRLQHVGLDLEPTVAGVLDQGHLPDPGHVETGQDHVPTRELGDTADHDRGPDGVKAQFVVGGKHFFKQYIVLQF